MAVLELARRAIGSFSPSTMPVMARRNYALELRAAFFLPFLLVVVDSAIIGVVVKNAFEDRVPEGALNRAVAILAASTAAANIVSFMWVRLSHGADKVRFVNALQLAMIILVSLIALAPRDTFGLWLTVGTVFASRVLWAGFVTVRSTVWGANYSPGVRARVTGKLATVQTGTLAILGLALGGLMNWNEQTFVWFFPAGCACAMLGVWAWSKIRVRGHKEIRRAELARNDKHLPSFNPAGVWRLLRHDRRYGRFLRNLSFLGLGNLMLIPLVTIVARDRFGMSYLGGILVSNSLPLAMMPFTIPLWARLLDRVHVIHFRALHSWSFVAAAFLCTLAVLLKSEVLLVLSSVMTGVGFGGGVLAWNIGHLDFAPKGMETQYMGAHQTLNGVRGLLAPFLAVEVYLGLTAIDAGLAWGAFAFCALLTLVGALGFQAMARAHPRERHPRTTPVETTPPSRAGIG
ncbi:MAG: MFS transporter [Phycisphaeraceae bacterium]|nr:MFS transporter [Phycisphaeraceae bacterium]MCW5753472.1 MFS transporter [Phycisphaeraceae bacterium]